MLLNKDEIKKILKESLPQLNETQMDSAAAALIAGSNKKWKEVDLKESLGANISIQCKDICALGDAHHKGRVIKAFVQEG